MAVPKLPKLLYPTGARNPMVCLALMAAQIYASLFLAEHSVEYHYAENAICQRTTVKGPVCGG